MIPSLLSRIMYPVRGRGSNRYLGEYRKVCVCLNQTKATLCQLHFQSLIHKTGLAKTIPCIETNVSRGKCTLNKAKIVPTYSIKFQISRNFKTKVNLFSPNTFMLITVVTRSPSKISQMFEIHVQNNSSDQHWYGMHYHMSILHTNFIW